MGLESIFLTGPTGQPHDRVSQVTITWFFGRKTRTSLPPVLEPLTSCFVRPLTTSPASCLCPNEIFVLSILYSFNFKMSIWDHKRIQIKKLSTTKLYNFSRSTTFIFVVSPSEIIYKIWISKLTNSNVIFHA